MSEQKKLSATYKLLRALGFNYSEEEYGDVSLWRVIKQFFLEKTLSGIIISLRDIQQ